MTGSKRRVGPLLLAALGLLGCRGSDTNAAEVTTGPPAEISPAPLPRPDPPPPPSVELARGLGPGDGLSAVVLDPRGEAALTLDQSGGVLLWPSFDPDQPDEVEPYTLIADEPLWMSLAQAEDGAFTIGLIDTANVGRIYRVEPQRGPDTPAKMTELFTRPPSDPLLELHVLDGGERVLTLGIDHRIRLYDAQGELLSQIDERSFSPWQLRVSGGVTGGVGEAPKLAAVLARPLRVQSLSLVDDTLARASEARTVELDRGPNRNDLALSPDGTTVAALRRPGRSRKFSVELIDLASGVRKLVGGEVNSNVRPRMHYTSDTHLLLESGVWDSGYWVDLASAVQLSEPGDALPDSKLAERLARTKHPKIELLGASEEVRSLPEEDSGLRFDTSVANGVRVALPRKSSHDTSVLVHPLAPPGEVEEDARLELRYASTISAAALDASGSRVAWVGEDEVIVDTLDVGSTRLSFDDHDALFVDLARWLDDEHLLIVQDPWVFVLSLADGSVDQHYLGGRTGRSFEYRAEAPGAGVLGFVDVHAKRWTLELRDSTLGKPAALDAAASRAWVCSDLASERVDQQPWHGFGACARASDDRIFAAEAETTRSTLHVLGDDEQRRIELPLGEVYRVAPSPDGRTVVVVLVREDDLVIASFDAGTGERLWTRGLPGGAWRTRIDWAGDGGSLVLTHRSSGHVYAARDGERLHTRRWDGLSIERGGGP